MSVKPDEIAFLKALQKAQRSDPIGGGSSMVRPVIKEMEITRGMAPKRCWYLLYKWTNQELYDYGMCVDGGWLTPKGLAKVFKEDGKEQGEV